MSAGTSDNGGGFFPAIGDDLGDGLAEDLRARVKAELEPGERLLWAGRSSPPPVRLKTRFFVALGIALALLAAGAFLLSLASADSRPRAADGSIAFRPNPDTQPAIPIGIAMICVGGIVLPFTIGAQFAERSARARQADTCYAVTDRRAIAWIPDAKSDGTRVLTLPRGHIRTVARVERPDGSGSIEFTLVSHSPYYLFAGEGFKSIPEVRRVEQIVRNHLTAPDTIATAHEPLPADPDVGDFRRTLS